MTTEPKIPERCCFNLVELKKKWRQRTAKIELRHEFDEVVTNQRIMMTFDFSLSLLQIENAEKDYHDAMYKNQNKLLDTDDEQSLSNEVRRTKDRLDTLNKRLVWLKELHKDFSFTVKVIQHKLKFKDEVLITEIIYQVDKKTIDRFDEFHAFLSSYVMLIQDYHEREQAQKWWMSQVAVDEAVSKAEWTIFEWTAEKDAFVLRPVVSTEETMIWKAREVIWRTWKASATMLQRELEISFPLAAQLIDQLEKEWIVWPQEWAKPRKVFIWPVWKDE